MNSESAGAAALNNAAGHGFAVTTVETRDLLHRCMRIGCGPMTVSTPPRSLIARAGRK